jgi:hypothetical protein
MKTSYFNNIRASKSQEWKTRSSGLDYSNFYNIYKILHKHKAHTIPSLQKPDGFFTSTQEETLDLIVNTLLSSHVSTPPHSTPSFPRPPTDPTCSSTVDTILSEVSIDMIVSKLNHYKSPGPDGIYNIMITKSWTHIKPIILNIFKDSLLSGHVPTPWQKSSSVIIPKKNPPSSPGNLRIINLSSNFLKILEKCVLVYLNEICRIEHSPNQFGFKSGVNTEHALAKLIKKINLSFSNKKVFLGIFLDLKSAFDNISFDSIDLALNNSPSPSIINNWISHYIRNRFVSFHGWRKI